MTVTAERIADNVARIRESIADAAMRSGRRAGEVSLIAVTKYVGIEEIDALIAAGCTKMGENRPQQLWDRADQLQGRPIHWHMIGHLQRNKARRTLPYVTLLHAGDSLRLLEAVDRLSQEAGRVTDVLVEVNVSGDATKHGFAHDEVEPLLPKLAELSGLRIRGLMAMASWGGSLDEARQDFIRLRELRDKLATACPPEISLDELSMGMSGDFEVAIEEGATLVRIGSAFYA
ncbi:MAG: YggS family pyridoxal phosphate-dependent enzyme [Planctomycetes bacterium]|nr:YggS family pyridoxal phosphate-dependent enzyme [Planctomycetota bacterium]MBL7037334.1 YggS family pyridoxal phosphate-dependent enzyme [Pirellulaceae bacterium]